MFEEDKDIDVWIGLEKDFLSAFLCLPPTFRVYFQMRLLSYYGVSLILVLVVTLMILSSLVRYPDQHSHWCQPQGPSETTVMSASPSGGRNLSELVRPEGRTVLVEARPGHCQGNTAISLLIAVFSAPGNSVARAVVRWDEAHCNCHSVWYLFSAQ